MPKHPFICAIVSDNSAAEQIELCQHSISSPVRIITTESSKCIVATKRVIEEGAAVIVSRGSVWSTIKKAFPLVPTLQTPITCCDAIEFLTKAKQYDTNIGVVSFPSHIAKMVTVAPHLGVSLTVHQVNNPDDIEKGCYEMRDKGMKVLVGGGHAVQWAQKLGLHGVLHTVSADGVIQVLNEADRILNAIISERSKDARVRTMLNALKDGAISLNEQGKVLEYNLPAQKMFANGESTMKSIRTFLQDTGIIEAVQQQLTWSGESKKYEKKQYLCNIIPAYSNDIYCGASVIIQDASQYPEPRTQDAPGTARQGACGALYPQGRGRAFRGDAQPCGTRGALRQQPFFHLHLRGIRNRQGNLRAGHTYGKPVQERPLRGHQLYGPA